MLNDDLMDAEQQLICKALGSPETYQAVLNCQTKESTYLSVSGDHIQFLYDGSCHCLLTFTSSGKIKMCDIPRTNLTSVSKKCFKSLGYGSILLDGKLPIDAWFVVNEMRNHFMKCLKDLHSYPFPTLEKAINVSSNKDFKQQDFSFYNLI